MPWQEDYLRKFYSGSVGWIDGTTQFHQLCASVIPDHGLILEVGCGPSNPTSRFLSSLGILHGLDVDPDLRLNDALNSFHILQNDEAYPFADNTFDACISNYVLEHIHDPLLHLKEVHRVLKPNGVYVFRTPNRFHYTTIVSGLTPHWFHKLMSNRLRNLAADSHDPYPTAYRLNSRKAIENHASLTRFQIVQMLFVAKRNRRMA